jgi:hypothetical protein
MHHSTCSLWGLWTRITSTPFCWVLFKKTSTTLRFCRLRQGSSRHVGVLSKWKCKFSQFVPYVLLRNIWIFDAEPEGNHLGWSSSWRPTKVQLLPIDFFVLVHWICIQCIVKAQRSLPVEKKKISKFLVSSKNLNVLSRGRNKKKVQHHLTSEFDSIVWIIWPSG